MLTELAMFFRYAAGLPEFLSRPLTGQEARRRISCSLAAREENFLKLLRRAVYDNPKSPYLRLLRHASVEFGDVEKGVREDGVETTLGMLYDAGVYVTGDEFKGRKPIRRGALEIPVRPQDFSNPLLARHYEAQTSGSRGVARRVVIDLDLLVHESAYIHEFMTGFNLWDRPIASWRPVPPVSSGMKLVLRHAKTGKSAERWFAQNRFDRSLAGLQFFVFTAYTVLAARLVGTPVPRPTFVPRDKVGRIVRWLAERKRRGTPAMFDTNASSAVRICMWAREHRLDLAGTFFRVGGEPLTAAKVRAVTDVGARISCHYSMTEIGHIGIACADRQAGGVDDGLDDVHLMLDKIAAFQRPKSLGPGGQSVDALVYTTILPSCPMLMLNVESGDYGVLERRDCGCPFDRLGFKMHLRNIRSYEKLTSEGVTFLGTELLRLVEEVLPARFGGSSIDYQLVEEEEAGMPHVSILIDPRVGDVSDSAVLSAVRQTLSDCPGGGIMTEQWQQAKTLRVIRRPPYATTSAKVLPLHIPPRS
jgi:hypothetical protein